MATMDVPHFIKVLLATVLLVGVTTAKPTSNGSVREGVSRFSNNFFKAVAESNQDNIVCSPLGIDIVLAMLSRGAKGDTLNQLKSSLNLPNSKSQIKLGYERLLESLNISRSYDLQLANKIFSGDMIHLEDKFVDDVKKIFKSDIQRVNFRDSYEAANIINNWAEKNTKNKIKELLKPHDIEDDTSFVLANAIYFKGMWKNYFSTIAEKPFYVDPKTTIHVSTMNHLDSFNTGFLKNARWIELPYAAYGPNQKKVSMVIIMPYSPKKLVNLQDHLDQINIPSMLASGKTVNVDLSLPAFTINTEIDVKTILEQMGINKIFTDEANLTGISKSPTKVSKILQKSVIQVNMMATEAAAVSHASGLPVSGRFFQPQVESTFEVNRPFFFMIYTHSEQLPLFMGKVVRPGVPSQPIEGYNSPQFNQYPVSVWVDQICRYGIPSMDHVGQ